MLITSPGTAGLSRVTGAPATLAQQVVGVRADTTTRAPVLSETLIGILFPSGPATLAVRMMRVNSPLGDAVTFSSALALINAIRPSRMVVNESVDWMV